MLINIHSYYSLRYGTLSIEQLIDNMQACGYDTAVLTDINNSSGVLDYIKACREKGFNGLAGMEYRNGDTLLYIGIAKNAKGFQELNELMTDSNLSKKALPYPAPLFNNCFVIYPYGSRKTTELRDNEYIGIKPKHLTKIVLASSKEYEKYVIWKPLTFMDKKGYMKHCRLRAVDNNLLLSQLKQYQIAEADEVLRPKDLVLEAYSNYPQIISNTEKLLRDCCFDFDFRTIKNKATFTGSGYDDKLLLEKLALEGMKYRYGNNNKEAVARVKKELAIIDQLGFSSYFLITWDIVRYAMARGFYYVGRGSGANSVVAYCLKITDVCPIELDLYFERFLNPKRKSPPDFDIDFSWDERDDVLDYIFKRYGQKHTALMGAMGTFKDRSIIRELGKVYGLPKAEIDNLIKNPEDIGNKNEVVSLLLSLYNEIEDYPNQRTIHSSGVIISELPITAYTALDMPPKGFQTAQIDMYTAEDIGFEKFDILSQRGIGHIKETAEIVRQNRGIKIDVHDVQKFKLDKAIQAQLKTGDTIGCFYVESPAMRQLLKKLKCEDYLTLVAASSIIRPGVARSGMMKAYIERFHNPEKTVYLHPVMEQQLKETFGVMVYQEDVLKVGHHFGGLDLADADVLRRMMSGKHRNKKHLQEIEAKYYNNCKSFGYPEAIAREVWRQIESFAGYSFSKAHSASFAVESFQSLYLKTYYPLEFMVAVINNWGGFYNARIYSHEAKKAGAILHLPCINTSNAKTIIRDKDIYFGFEHIKSLEHNTVNTILAEREQNGAYTGLENFVLRTGIHLEQLIILIRVGALRSTGMDKKALLWEAHSLLNNKTKPDKRQLFYQPKKQYSLPKFETVWIEDVYDEIELLGFPVNRTLFDLLDADVIGDITCNQLLNYVGKIITILGDYVTYKPVMTIKNEYMAFGTFLDKEGNFFDTTHFPPAMKAYPLKGAGIYVIKGKVVEDFGFPSIEVETCVKQPLKADVRA